MSVSSSDETVASHVPFADLCKLLDSISKMRKPVARKEQMRKFITSWRKTHSIIHKDHPDTNMLAKRFIHIFCLNKNSQDAKSLLNFRAPNLRSNEIGDFAAQASKILRLRLARDCTMNIEQLNGHLDSISIANAKKEQQNVERELEMLCRKVSDVEMKWLIRILLKQMKISMQENTVLSVFHPEAGQLYDVTTSLAKVALQLHDLDTRLDVIQIQLFNAFRPMLANRAPPDKVPTIMGNKPFYVEIKYDGERVQLHKDGDKYKYFSRNGNEFTESYGSSPEKGSLTPFIHNLFASNVKSCILDAEMVGWNPEAKCIATKGEQFDVKSLKEGDDLNPCLVVFDCLMLNGDVLSMRPLSDRIDIMNYIFTGEVEGRYMLAKRSVLETTKELVDRLNEAIEQREEGIVIKRPDSTYRLNTRSNEGGWLKIKPDYVDAINDDFDLLIVGGYFGEGRRSNLMSHFLLAAASPTSSPDEDPTKFLSVCKVGSGYSLKELYDLNIHLNQCPLIRPKDKSNIPQWLELGHEKADVYIEPKNSKVLQVRAAEITESSAYAVGYTLRFPRVQKIRTDKDWKSCTTTSEFDQVRQDCAGKLAQRFELKVNEAGEISPAKKRRVGGSRASVKPTLGSQFKPADLRGLKRIGNAFANKEICVVNGSEEHSKQWFERKAAELGAAIVQHPGANTYCVIAERKTLPVQNIISDGTVNVARAQWLLRCVEEQKLVSWEPRDMWFATFEVENGFKSNFDDFGDSYTEPVNVSQLKEILKNVKNPKHLTRDEVAELMMEAVPDYKYGMFYNCRLYLDRFVDIDDPETAIENSSLQLVNVEAKLYGAAVTNSVNDCTHVILLPSDLSRLNQYHRINRSRQHKMHLVTDSWLSSSIRCEKRLDETNFQPIM